MKTQLIIAALPVMMSHGCAFGIEGSGKVVTENRTVVSFTGIDLQCSADVYFMQGDEQSIKVEAEDNIVGHIKTEVKNDELTINTDGTDFNSQKQIIVYVTVKELCKLELTGSGNMIGKSHINCDNMTLRVGGSGDITADVRSLTMTIKVSGSGNLQVSGTSTSTDIKIAGSGNVNARNLQTMNSSVSISGSGQSTINASDEVYVNITGSGDVQYVGEPLKLKTSITGSGNVSKI
ncbi:MAG: head GIN domain-containing protein [Bacteroidota bacterium]